MINTFYLPAIRFRMIRKTTIGLLNFLQEHGSGRITNRQQTTHRTTAMMLIDCISVLLALKLMQKISFYLYVFYLNQIKMSNSIQTKHNAYSGKGPPDWETIPFHNGKYLLYRENRSFKNAKLFRVLKIHLATFNTFKHTKA